MIRQVVFNLLLTLSCSYALLKGGAVERYAAAVILVGTLLTVVVASSFDHRFRHMELGMLVVDVAILASFVTIAVKSKRFWPIWIAGLQLIGTGSHVVRAFAAAAIPKAYMDAVALWSYPILIILWIGTARHQRRLMMFGADESWKT